jgi:hypothetical protein
MPARQHTTRVERFTSADEPTVTALITVSTARYQPHCTCGWSGDGFGTAHEASDRADLHRRNAVLAGGL